MIHFSCDRCKKKIDTEEELRYEVKIEVNVGIEPNLDSQDEDDRDNLNEIDEWLSRIEDEECDSLCEELYQIRRYDLCSECYEIYMQNPLAIESPIPMGFSQN